jgi:hypothetical protein
MDSTTRTFLERDGFGFLARSQPAIHRRMA